MDEVDRLHPCNELELLIKIVGRLIHLIGSTTRGGGWGFRDCPFLAGALKRRTVWLTNLLTNDREEVNRQMALFLEEFLGLEPTGSPSRAVVIILPGFQSANTKDAKRMKADLDRLTTQMGLGGYYDQGLMPGSINMPVPPPPGTKFLLPMLIVRHMVEEDRSFIKEGSDNPEKAAAATTAYLRLFGHEP